jgi:hypothetical protein
MLKPRQKAKYNQTLNGVFGEFGKGADAHIFYIQTALKPDDLDKITLISEIPGSNKWSVRDLFQRDVDNERVTKSLIPYFKNTNQLKFFNPLTLTIVPSAISTTNFVDTVPFIDPKEKEIDGQDCIVLELPGVYRYSYVKSHPELSYLDWDDSKVKIVAVDGQHRLSALKRLKQEVEVSGEDPAGFMTWKIPAVVFSVRAETQSKKNYRVLDVIRSIFKYINTSAQTPSVTRQILLDDESILNICTQEFLEYSHENDILDVNERAADRLPLLFFDWRGHQQDGANIVNNPGALKNVTEIKDWLREYILGEDFSSSQMVALGIQPTYSIARSFSKSSMSSDDIASIRILFRDNVLPGLSHLLQNIQPYKDYIEKVREIELECESSKGSSDIKKYALHKLKFGDDPSADSTLTGPIEMAKEELLEDIQDIFTSIFDKDIYRRDIGLRGIIASFSQLKPFYKRAHTTCSYLEYSKWFEKYLNISIEGLWYGLSHEDEKQLLKHITYDHNEKVVNYRLGDVKKSLGRYVSLIVLSYANKDGTIEDGIYKEYFYKELEALEDQVEKGFEKEGRALLKDEYYNKAPIELKKAAKEYSAVKSGEWIHRFNNEISKVIFI